MIAQAQLRSTLTAERRAAEAALIARLGSERDASLHEARETRCALRRIEHGLSRLRSGVSSSWRVWSAVCSEAKLAAALDAATEERVEAEAALRQAAESECARSVAAAERERDRQLAALREAHAAALAEQEELSDAVEAECRRLYASLQERTSAAAAAEQRADAEAARAASWEGRFTRESERCEASRLEALSERRSSHARSQQFDHLEQRCQSLTKQSEMLEARLERSESALAKKRQEYSALAKHADSLRVDRDLATRCGFYLCQKLQQVDAR